MHVHKSVWLYLSIMILYGELFSLDDTDWLFTDSTKKHYILYSTDRKTTVLDFGVDICIFDRFVRNVQTTKEE